MKKKRLRFSFFNGLEAGEGNMLFIDMITCHHRSFQVLHDFPIYIRFLGFFFQFTDQKNDHIQRNDKLINHYKRNHYQRNHYKMIEKKNRFTIGR